MKEKFSDRIGVTKPSEVLQIDGISEKLKSRLWNIIRKSIYDEANEYLFNSITLICDDFFGFNINHVKNLPNDECLVWIFNQYKSEKFKWYDVYNFLEWIGENFRAVNGKENLYSFYEWVNEVLENENAGFRFIDGILVPITNKEELHSIENSIAESKAKKMYGTAKHFETSIELFAKRPDPDYRNSIKESISAVESLVKRLTGETGGGLDKALTLLDNKVKFHGAFKSALSSLYGYTSDESGIRHPILEEKEIGFDEAKYMLVSCSAFVNFIIAKAEKAGLLK